jgi:integrase
VVGTPKGTDIRHVPMTTRLAAAVKDIRHLRAPRVFCHDDGRPWTFYEMKTGLRRQQKRAGLRVTGWHVLRHTFCSHLAMKGAPAVAIQRLAGHKSIAVTNRYMHSTEDAARAAIRLLQAG